MKQLELIKKIYSRFADKLSKDIFCIFVERIISGNDESMNKLLPLLGLEDEYNAFVYDFVIKIENAKRIVLVGLNNFEYIYSELINRFLVVKAKITDGIDANAQAFASISNVNVQTYDEFFNKGSDLNETVFIVTPSKDFYCKSIIESLYYHAGKEHLSEKNIILFYKTTRKYYLLDNMQYFDFWDKCGENTTFVDCGCYDGKSTLNFIQRYQGQYKKIYAFEPGEQQFSVCKRNLRNVRNVELINAGVGNSTGEERYYIFEDAVGGASFSQHILHYMPPASGSVSVKTLKLDDVCDEAGFIKIDIEGNELCALQGAEKLIKKFKPKLAIAIYHKPDDIIEISSFILSLHPDYKLALRHYGVLPMNETVLYAWSLSGKE